MVDIRWLVENGPCKKFDAGQQIPCPGGPVASERAMYIMLSGRVDIYKKEESGGVLLVGVKNPGDVFGGREFFTNTVECVYLAGADTIVYLLTESSFNDLSWSQPDILFEILKTAYMPEEKPEPSGKAAPNEQAKGSAAKQKAAGQPKAAEKAPPAAKGAKQQAKADAGAAASGAAGQKGSQASGGKKALPVVISELGPIFPDGHKQYPGITKPEYTRLVFAKEYECPFCKKPFNDFKVFRSKLYEAAPMRFDLRKSYTDFQTEWYDVIVCQNCLFSTFYTYFTEPKPFKKELIEGALTDARMNILLDFDGERDIDYVFTSHYLALLCSDAYYTVARQIRAKIWGNLSWLYEDVEDEEMARYAAEMAANAYETVYKESHLKPVQEQVTCLSIAGMQNRAGIDNNLMKFLFTAKTMQTGDKTYAKLAEDFMYELRSSEEGESGETVETTDKKRSK